MERGRRAESGFRVQEGTRDPRSRPFDMAQGKVSRAYSLAFGVSRDSTSFLASGRRSLLGNFSESSL